MTAESSAIVVGKSLVVQSVALGGLAVQAAVSAGDGDDFVNYKCKSQLFCLARCCVDFCEDAGGMLAWQHRLGRRAAAAGRDAVAPCA
jgi:hypothetical protein